MKISHTQLDSCLKNPRGWIQAQASPGSGPRYGFNQALANAIHRFHKNKDSKSARRFLELSVERHFTNPVRSAQVLEWFDSYVEWYKQSKVLIADSRFNIKLQLGVWLELSGQIHRLDMLSSGYRAVLLGSYSANWQDQLRIPLLQRAIASRYGRPEDEIEMGVQQLDGSGIETVSYTASEIEDAVLKFKSLSSRLQRYAQNYPSLMMS